MGHCKPEELEDLKEIFTKIASLDGIKEKQFGTFYFRSKGFLHFHSKDGRRWADIRDGVTWGEEVDIPFGVSKSVKKKFLKQVCEKYERTTTKKI